MKTIKKMLLGIAAVTLATHAHAVMFLMRPYQPNTAQWLTRDPMGEDGGQNLYCFVRNNPVCKFDLFGLYDKCCCTGAKIADGKKELIDRFNEAKKIFDDAHVKRDPNSKNGLSCYDSNQAILQYMSPSPSCWQCTMERRRGPKNLVGGSWDENFIVCVSHPTSGPEDKIAFDWFLEKTPPGQPYSDYIRDHPTLEYTGSWYPYNDCSTTNPRKPGNRDWLDILIK